ncbi:hypothetical protein VP01_2078g2 [Puccinia sorghi]|uniref:Uncharacterized protein n=1 Tax=Puccinia sorghi TaxID=27349 RepID=A0A0L6VB23_9BASI|nr:hypothetical protein VP01_2078g2 [Puccinia sorghi]
MAAVGLVIGKPGYLLADDNYIESAGEGFVLIKAKKNNPIKLKALNVPKLVHTLISLGCLYERGCDIVRTSDKNFDSSNKGDVILSGSIKGDVWSTNVVVTQEGPQDTLILRC